MQYDDGILRNDRSEEESTMDSSFYPEEPKDAAPTTKAQSWDGDDDYVTTSRQLEEENTASNSSDPSQESFGGDARASAVNAVRISSTITQRAMATSQEFDEDMSIDFNESVTSEERRLLQEIEEDARRDKDIEDGPRSRAALLASPLVQAAAAALAASSRGNGGTSSRWGSMSLSMHSDSQHDLQQDDLDSDPHLNQSQASMSLELGVVPEDPDARNFEDKTRGLRRRRRRRLLFAFGWLVAIGLIAASVAIVLVRRNSDGGEEVTPTVSPAPTNNVTPSPTREPSFRTRPPTGTPPISPSSPTTMPIASSLPTARPFAVTPSPLGPTSTPVSFTPIPSSSGGGDQRQEDIMALCVEISGVLKLLDRSTPQFAAYQWILFGDPQQLLASDSPAIEQRYILAVLYYSTNGDNTWLRCGQPGDGTRCDVDSRRFLGGTTECQWLGVSCNGGVVTTVNLRENGLQGELPREIGEIPRLESLILSRNTLSSTIPTNLGRLQYLRVMLLNRNQISGTIPDQLGSLSSIWYLHLGNNLLDGTIPQEIFVRSLQHLDLGDNAIFGEMPPTLSEKSPKLINIDVGNNALSGSIPTELGALSLLQSFTADNNALTGSLSGSLFMDALTVFDVSSNLLTGRIPEELFDSGTSLTLLNLGNNTIRGNISRRFAELPNLEQLVLWRNEFIGIVPSRLGLLTNLEVLHLSQTQLEGTMPEGICDLRTFPLRVLSADCGGDPPELACDCCSVCFPSQ